MLDGFLVGKELGRGGFGITYVGLDTTLQTTRCIKEFFPKFCRRTDDLSVETNAVFQRQYDTLSARFRKEAQIMGRLRSSHVANIADVYDLWETNGTMYILMDYLEGCTLDEYITRMGSGMPWRDAKAVLETVLKTLSEIHASGYLHRDLSLNNIFRMKDGTVRLIDFGSAEKIEDARDYPEKTWRTNKKYYSSPEQISGSPQGPWSDIYSMGVCMFKLCSGGFPQTWKAGEPFPELADAGTQTKKEIQIINEVIRRATQPDPRKRYQTAEEMLLALEGKKAGNPWKSVSAIVGVAALAAVIGIGGRRLVPQTPPQPTQTPINSAANGVTTAGTETQDPEWRPTTVTTDATETQGGMPTPVQTRGNKSQSAVTDPPEKTTVPTPEVTEAKAYYRFSKDAGSYEGYRLMHTPPKVEVSGKILSCRLDIITPPDVFRISMEVNGASGNGGNIRQNVTREIIQDPGSGEELLNYTFNQTLDIGDLSGDYEVQLKYFINVESEEESHTVTETERLNVVHSLSTEDRNNRTNRY